jgi:chemotaxis methyl-accepting protein methylase
VTSTETGSLVRHDRFRHLVFEGSARAAARSRQPVAPPVHDVSRQREALPSDLPGVPHETHEFIRVVLQQAGLAHQQYRPRPLVRRVQACLRAINADSLSDATTMIRSDRISHRAAADALLIGVTEFFRDRRVFDALGVGAVPLLARRRGVVDAWSVGCSDGAELYSIAMILAEQRRWCIGRLLGTDCRQGAIDRAVTARYSDAAVRNLPKHLMEKYIRQTGHSVVVSDDLRRITRWRVQDALTTNDYACWDLILCRNVAIYLDPEAARDLWLRLYLALRPGGVLVVGRAERPCGVRLRRLEPCVYIKDHEQGADHV